MQHWPWLPPTQCDQHIRAAVSAGGTVLPIDTTTSTRTRQAAWNVAFSSENIIWIVGQISDSLYAQDLRLALIYNGTAVITSRLFAGTANQASDDTPSTLREIVNPSFTYDRLFRQGVFPDSERTGDLNRFNQTAARRIRQLPLNPRLLRATVCRDNMIAEHDIGEHGIWARSGARSERYGKRQWTEAVCRITSWPVAVTTTMNAGVDTVFIIARST